MNRLVGVSVAVIASLAWAGPTLASPQTSLDKCQKTVKTEATKYVSGRIKAVEGCLKKVSTRIIGNNASVAAAVPGCVPAFRKINNSADPTKTLEAKMRAKILLKCNPGAPGAEHTLQDILGTGAGVPQPIDAENINTWCKSFGGDGAINTLQEWMDCIVEAHTCQANQAIATQYPRALEWFDLLQPAMAGLVPPPADALAALAAVNDALEGANDDDIPDLVCGTTCGDGVKNGFDQCDGADLDGNTCTSFGYTLGTLACDAACGFDTSDCSGLPALPCGNGVREGAESCDGADLDGETCVSLGNTGGTLGCTLGCGFDTSGCTAQALPATAQTTCWDDGSATIPCAGTEQDGDIRAGAPLAYADNGDGTITDLNTKLIWEKMSDDGDIHYRHNTYAWTDAFAVHVVALNTANFAGYSDWRVPNRKELVSLLNFERFPLGIDPVFNNACVPGCSVLTCSCMSPSFQFWSSTTMAALPGQAWSVDFAASSTAQVAATTKSGLLPVRAVRGGL